MSSPDFLGRAIETVKKAIEFDTAQNYEEAYKSYMNARMYEPARVILASLILSQVDLFMLALKCTPSRSA
jgi:MIT (microtubule interacting and transport) domain